MSADKYTTEEIIPSLREAGWCVRGEAGRYVNGRFISTAPEDEADLFCIRSGTGTFVEVKSFKGDGWDTSKWGLTQRVWLRSHHSFANPSWLWLCGGRHNPNYDPVKYNPRRSWLIPADIALSTVTLVECFQSTFPVRKIKRIDMRELNLSIEKRFEIFRLNWLGDGRWSIPDTHLFCTTYGD